jgi:hypothetical protein
MTRDEREQELRNMIYGHYHELAEEYLRAAGLPPGSTLPMGLRVTQMIQFILDKEFPPDTP